MAENENTDKSTSEKEAEPNLFREGIKPEMPGEDAISPMVNPREEKSYTRPAKTQDLEGDRPVGKGDTTAGDEPKIDTNVEDVPEAKDDEEGSTAEEQNIDGDGNESSEDTTDSESSKYTMPPKHAKQFVDDLIRQINYTLKNDGGDWVSVPIKPTYKKYDALSKDTLCERIKSENEKAVAEVTLEEDDIELLREPAIEWLEEIGFKMSPGWRLIVAAFQVIRKKAKDFRTLRADRAFHIKDLDARMASFFVEWDRRNPQPQPDGPPNQGKGKGRRGKGKGKEKNNQPSK